MYLPFIAVGSVFGVETVSLAESDEGVEGPGDINIEFPFGSSVQTSVYVSSWTILVIQYNIIIIHIYFVKY